MSAEIVYSGPGKVFFDSVAFDADGTNGSINLSVEEPTKERGTAMFGRVLETQDDQFAKVTFTPFDRWGLLSTLFPTFIGCSTTATTTALGTQVAGGTGAVAPGTRPHDIFAGSANGLAGASVFTQDARLYNLVRGAVSKHPGMKLGVGQPLFEGAELTCLGDPAKAMGASGFLFDGTNPVTGANDGTSAAATDPNAASMAIADFVNGKWTGDWGTDATGTITPVTGFSGMEPEDYWQLVPDVKYSTLKVQGLSRHLKLDSAAFMVKARLVGPTHTQLLAKLLAHTLGSTLAESGFSSLKLTGPSSKSIYLKGCEVKGAGFEFGGTRLGTGEVGFVTKAVFTSGVIQPFVIFSS